MEITIDEFQVKEGDTINLKNYTTIAPKNFQKNK